MRETKNEKISLYSKLLIFHNSLHGLYPQAFTLRFPNCDDENVMSLSSFLMQMAIRKLRELQIKSLMKIRMNQRNKGIKTRQM